MMSLCEVLARAGVVHSTNKTVCYIRALGYIYCITVQGVCRLTSKLSKVRVHVERVIVSTEPVQRGLVGVGLVLQGGVRRSVWQTNCWLERGRGSGEGRGGWGRGRERRKGRGRGREKKGEREGEGEMWCEEVMSNRAASHTKYSRVLLS